MKLKTAVKLYIIILSIGTILSLYIPKSDAAAGEPLVIPSEAIRLRILANSDGDQDQELKRHVRDAVNKEITKWVADLTSINDARSLIQSKLPEIQRIAENTVARENSTQSVKVEFGKVAFPTKLYGQFLYPAGEYEAILVTLGEGKGANWWCVLFPPLCFLDFSNSVAVSDGFDEKEKTEKSDVSEETAASDSYEESQANEKEPVYTGSDEEEVEVKFFIKELWEKIFG